jgi:cold-inducible RNA-binding protein
MGRKLYVGNLPYEVGETELQEVFARAGSVESVNVMRDQATGRARGFAFVEMSTDEEAQNAITALNGTQVGGRSLTVNEARPKALVVRRWPAGEGPSAGPWLLASSSQLPCDPHCIAPASLNRRILSALF